jgi:hypothetical protein
MASTISNGQATKRTFGIRICGTGERERMGGSNACLLASSLLLGIIDFSLTDATKGNGRKRLIVDR